MLLFLKFRHIEIKDVSSYRIALCLQCWSLKGSSCGFPAACSMGMVGTFLANGTSRFFYQKNKGDGINSSAQMVPHCLSGEFASSANVALLYAVLQEQNCVKKLFSGFSNPCKKFLWEV